MLISTFDDERDNEPSRGEASWEQLAQAFARPRATACVHATCGKLPCNTCQGSKVAADGAGCEACKGTGIQKCLDKYGAAWAPAYWPLGGKRGNIGVEGITALVIDLDHVTDDDVIPVLERLAPWKHILHASHSDRPGDRCLRVVIAISRTVLGREWRRFWLGAVQALGLPADGQTKDAARLYFRPSRPSDACHDAVDGTGYLYGTGGTDILDVEEVLAFAPPEPELAPGETYADFVVPDFAGAPDREKAEEAVLALAEAWPATARHTAQLALAGALARAGWPVELIADFCAAVAEVQQPGNADLQKRLAAARSSVDKVHAGINVQGWPSLINMIGEEPVARARRALGMEFLPEVDPEFSEFLDEEAVNAPPPAPPTPTPSGTPLTEDIDAALRSVERKLQSRKDADSIRDAGYLKKVRDGAFIVDATVPEQDRKTAFLRATLAVVRSVPPGTTHEQIRSRMLASAGLMREDLDESITTAMGALPSLPPILARRDSSTPSDPTTPGAAPLDEFVTETSGIRAGRPIANAQHNFVVALTRLGVSFKYNQFARHKILFRGDDDPVRIEDVQINSLMFEIERLHDFYPPKDKFYDYCADLAHKNAYHPVIDYLDALPEWARIVNPETWLIEFGGAPDTPFVRAISRIVLVAAVRRVRRPGCKFDEMLILEGPQGCQKSSALRALCPEADWFADQFKLDGDPKHFIEQSSGKWILEAAELKGMSAKESNDLKSQLSTTHDIARQAYAREPVTVARQSILIGTTNDSQYLKDATGDRRYWPVAITKTFDVAGLRAVRDQLWAAAAQLDLEHPEDDYIRLPPELYAAAKDEQDARKIDTPIKIALEDALGGAVGRIRVQDVWKILGFADRLPTSAEQLQVSAAMQMLEWEHHKRARCGSRTRSACYMRGDGPQRDILLTVIGDEDRGYSVREMPPAPPAVNALSKDAN